MNLEQEVPLSSNKCVITGSDDFLRIEGSMTNERCRPDPATLAVSDDSSLSEKEASTERRPF